jgi:hypothetical protein
MNTEADFYVGSPQWQWLQNDLAKVNRTETPWVIFFGHRPMYVDSYSNFTYMSAIPVMDCLISNIEPLLFKYRVNVALWAHHHSYQRHSAIYQSKVVQKSQTIKADIQSDDTVGFENVDVYFNPQATVHMIVGTGGADFSFDDIGETVDSPFPDGNASMSWYAWSEIFFYRYGFSRLTAVNSTHLEIIFRCSTDGNIYDRSLIIQPFGDNLNWSVSDSGKEKNEAQNAFVNDKIKTFSENSNDLLGIATGIFSSIMLCFFTFYCMHSKR